MNVWAWVRVGTSCLGLIGLVTLFIVNQDVPSIVPLILGTMLGALPGWEVGKIWADPPPHEVIIVEDRRSAAGVS